MKLYIHFFFYAFLLVQLFFFPIEAYAYLGPGAGLGLIGALLAAIIVILVIVFGLILYPIRLLKKHRSSKALNKKKERNSDDNHENVA